MFFSIGTSALMQPAASLPYEALRNGVPVVEITPDETPLTHHVTYALPGPAGEVLPELLNQYNGAGDTVARWGNRNGYRNR